MHLHLGHLHMLLSKATYNEYICQTKEKRQYIAVGTVMM